MVWRIVWVKLICAAGVCWICDILVRRAYGSGKSAGGLFGTTKPLSVGLTTFLTFVPVGGVGVNVGGVAVPGGVMWSLGVGVM